MLLFLLYVLATIGLTNILVHGKIFEETIPIKPFLKKRLHPNVYEVFDCYECMGTWAGFLCGALILSTHWPIVLACGFAGGLLSIWNNLLFEWINSKIEFVITESPHGTQEEHTSQT